MLVNMVVSCWYGTASCWYGMLVGMVVSLLVRYSVLLVWYVSWYGIVSCWYGMLVW